VERETEGKQTTGGGVQIAGGGEQTTGGGETCSEAWDGAGREGRAGPSGREWLGGYSWRYPEGVAKEECVWLWVNPARFHNPDPYPEASKSKSVMSQERECV